MSDEVEITSKAREMGWVPREEFKGADDKWIPADEFVDRGEHLLPILHATNKRLKGDVENLKGTVQAQTNALRAAQETIAELSTYHEEQVKQKVAEARDNLRSELANANREGNHEAAAKITDQLVELSAEAKLDADRRAEEEAKRRANANARPVDYRKDASFVAWQEQNPWYGVDLVRTGIANTLSYKLRDPSYEGYVEPEVKGKAFLDKLSASVESEIAKLTGGRPNGESKVEGGGTRSGGGGGGNSKGKSYESMPKEAKEACDSFERSLVGPNKRYKTKDEMRKNYATRYFNGGSQ